MGYKETTSGSIFDICILKENMRKEMHSVKQSISNEDMVKQSSSLCNKIEKTDFWIKSKTVLLYSNLSKEISVNQLIKSGLKSNKIVTLPRYDSKTGEYAASAISSIKDLSIGIHNIMEPLASCPEIGMNQLDLVIVPGVAFDHNGGRLGRGGGYYDQFLKGMNATFCGVCFREQVTDKTPQELHDIKMNIVMSPDGKVDFDLI